MKNFHDCLAGLWKGLTSCEQKRVSKLAPQIEMNYQKNNYLFLYLLVPLSIHQGDLGHGYCF